LDAARSLFVTDEESVLTEALGFDSVVRVQRQRSDAFAVDRASSCLGQVFAAADAALERDVEILWIHTSALRDVWDAEEEQEAEEEDLPPPIDDDGFEEEAIEAPRVTLELPESSDPPERQLHDDDHPDLVFRWMQRYGANVRAFDDLVGGAMEAWKTRKPSCLIAGTSGVSLGENGWIGHGVGPLRSGDIRLPFLVSADGPLRIHQLAGDLVFVDVLKRLAAGQPVVTSEAWAAPVDPEKRIEIDSDRAERAVTTEKWFYVRDFPSNDGRGLASDKLFLKPDDQFDANDVARLRRDVLAGFDR
ncbi:MAG: hypothetical protein AAGJ83_11265, partial [Planctomycetota bacterium]